MCLAIPARIVDLHEAGLAVVDVDGVRIQASVALIDDPAIGDYVIVHVGHALNKVDPLEAERTLALLREMGALSANEQAA